MSMSKVPVEVLSPEEAERLIAHPTSDDVVGLREQGVSPEAIQRLLGASSRSGRRVV